MNPPIINNNDINVNISTACCESTFKLIYDEYVDNKDGDIISVKFPNSLIDFVMSCTFSFLCVSCSATTPYHMIYTPNSKRINV